MMIFKLRTASRKRIDLLDKKFTEIAATVVRIEETLSAVVKKQDDAIQTLATSSEHSISMLEELQRKTAEINQQYSDGLSSYHSNQDRYWSDAAETLKFIAEKADGFREITSSLKETHGQLIAITEVLARIDSLSKSTHELIDGARGQTISHIDSAFGSQSEAIFDRQNAAMMEIKGHIDRFADVLGKMLMESDRARGVEGKKALNTIAWSIKNTAFTEFRQHEALSILRGKLGFDLPLTRGWAGSPDFLLRIYEQVLEQKPEVVVELGSGVSTLTLAAALKQSGKGRLFSLEHDERYALETDGLLRKAGLREFVTLEYCPLVHWMPPQETSLGSEWKWYSVPQSVKEIAAIDLLIIDGPPESTGAYARYPAVPQFRNKLHEGSVVMLDDANRPHEEDAAKSWSQDVGEGVRFDLEMNPKFDKGLAVLVARAVDPTSQVLSIRGSTSDDG